MRDLLRKKKRLLIALLFAVILAVASASTLICAQISPYAGISSLPHSYESTSLIDDTNYSITENMIDLLARAITAEQGYATSYEIGSAKREQIIDCYYLTGAVILNRIESEEFPDNLYDVINQPGQYACVNNGAIERPYDDIAWEVAEELLTYGTEIPADVVFQAQFTQGSGIYKHIGNQYFCRR